MSVWTLRCVVFDDSCSSLYHLTSDTKNDFHETVAGRNHSVLFREISQRSLFQFLLPFPSTILCCISAQSLPPATTCSYCSLYQMWQPWAYLLVFVQFACWHTDVSRWSSGQPWWLSPFHCTKHCWCVNTSLWAYFQCSHRVVLVPFCITCNLHVITVWFWQAIWLPEWCLQLTSSLAFHVSKGRAGHSNTLLRTLKIRNEMSKSNNTLEFNRDMTTIQIIWNSNPHAEHKQWNVKNKH